MKKIFLVLSMFLFMTNVKALSFNVDLTNIEDEGSNSLGTIEKIDIPNKELDVLFQDIGDEVNFTLTINNYGNRAGTLKSITVESTNDKIEYTNNLPEGGLAINGNDTNSVTITAKVKEGAANGKSTSTITIKYNYDEGSCPDGEILSEDESMCLCPEGLERNETGICVKPEKETIECEDDEIYNETKKICEKKVVPTKEKTTPTKTISVSNPKTLDNIVLITLLFLVSGLGIYAVMYKKLQTKKKKITVGVLTGVVTLALSFTVLASVFGLDNLLSAIVNPITKSKEVVVTVNEEIDLIETWDGECSLDVSELTPDNIFQGGSGTEEDPYQVKTAEQLSCFAKSVNNGTTYEGQYIKQTKDIKLNDHLNDQAEAGDLSNAHVWIPAGYGNWNSEITTFAGSYDGNEHYISGLYLTIDSKLHQNAYVGLFGHATNASFKDLSLVDSYFDIPGDTGGLVGTTTGNLTIDNISTYGNANFTSSWGSAIAAYVVKEATDVVTITNSTNNMDMVCNGSCNGFVREIYKRGNYIETTDNDVILTNNTNNGNITLVGSNSYFGPMFGTVYGTNVLIDNCENNGNMEFSEASDGGSRIAGIVASVNSKNLTLTNSHNTGDFTNSFNNSYLAGVAGELYVSNKIIVDNCYNSGNIVSERWPTDQSQMIKYGTYASALIASVPQSGGEEIITNCFNTGDIEVYNMHVTGIISNSMAASSTITNCFNTGTIKGYGYVGGISSETYASNRVISKCYNTGDIYLPYFVEGGGITGNTKNSVTVENTYNTGNIYATGTSANYVGGLCSSECNVINSYNRGNIITANDTTYYGGLVGGSGGGSVTNSYNSGNITYESASIVRAGGFATGSVNATNSYNLGNITATQNTAKSYYSSYIFGTAGGTINNCVNKGNISLTLTVPLGDYSNIYMYGIGGDYKDVTNSFNAGTITYDASAITTPMSTNTIYFGEITGTYRSGSSGNKFKNQNGFALGCYGVDSSCTLEQSQAVGTYTRDDAPDILSIINGDDAFEILEGEELPTLKVFNQ